MVASANSRRLNIPKKPATGFGNNKKPTTKPAKPNASILSFFKKADKPEDSLFVGASTSTDTAVFQPETDDTEDPQDRFNEIVSPIKKRKFSASNSPIEDNRTDSTPVTETGNVKVEPEMSTKNHKRPARGPFIDSDSDDSDDNEAETSFKPVDFVRERPPVITHKLILTPRAKDEISKPTRSPRDTSQPVHAPLLKHEDSSYAQLENYSEFEDLEPFEGEEFREMRFMQEQAMLEEAEENGDILKELRHINEVDEGSLDRSCPICGGNMTFVSTDEATRHVNSCLDGNPTPLPNSEHKPSPTETPEDTAVEQSAVGGNSLQAISRSKPPQANPFEPSRPSSGAKSAFSRLMSNNAEDAAWATAAASEKAARGKPSYERTCPFYKIMPGLSVCVDAFRYNAIEGCKAYFLSHFHSDHYIGLTARWTHGPIYCSKVTGSLVKRQLGTADKWVVELEFEKNYDIPGTDGATVTMIPANHCPGSSMFLFEKPISKDQSSRVRRILHCGDFRACPSHINHDLLRPDILDSISGITTRKQKIDICYLDTTYLNPRYSFPPQNDVINASADLCANLSPDPNCKDNIWGRPPNATPSMSQYFQKEAKQDNLHPPHKTNNNSPKHRLLVICGTYSIGKERICIAIAKALKSKIFASPAKIKICKQLGIPELTERLTSNPLDAQVHMQMLMELRAETLQEYLNGYKPHFSRIVGFRPSGWNFRPKDGKAVAANAPPSTIPTEQILHGKGWRTRFGYRDFVPQRGSTSEAMCFGVPYSEHSSFRELAMFVMGLRIEKIVPTVNVGSEHSRARMKAWTDRWISERRKHGLVRPLIEGEIKEENTGELELWYAKRGDKGGGAWW